ncbi:hypothetical protein ACLM5J_11890 [Nocardioides sp. Bht2]|uniref:hypothetical protein n=1 Tax=Nocardioides sp. Bht2 TaxID=3392297 RepID=UPI0039B50826
MIALRRTCDPRDKFSVDFSNIPDIQNGADWAMGHLELATTLQATEKDCGPNTDNKFRQVDLDGDRGESTLSTISALSSRLHGQRSH